VAGNDLAALLRELRTERGRSLRGAARDLDVDPAYLHRVETGEKRPSPEFQDRLARYYDVEPEVVMMSAGAIPEDVLAILRANPDLIERLRREYADGTTP
jgi:transcriptional regulator with XRE-family HTH domain